LRKVSVASFEPDAQDFLHICQNPGSIDEEVLHLLAEKIEGHHLHGINDNIRKLKLGEVPGQAPSVSAW
jgi:hypothetical protein